MPRSPSVVTIIIMVERCLQTSVWILKGLEIESGILSLASDRLRLEALERVVFDVALAEAAVIFPQIQFDRRCRITIGTAVTSSRLCVQMARSASPKLVLRRADGGGSNLTFGEIGGSPDARKRSEAAK